MRSTLPFVKVFGTTAVAIGLSLSISEINSAAIACPFSKATQTNTQTTTSLSAPSSQFNQALQGGIGSTLVSASRSGLNWEVAAIGAFGVVGIGGLLVDGMRRARRSDPALPVAMEMPIREPLEATVFKIKVPQEALLASNTEANGSEREFTSVR